MSEEIATTVGAVNGSRTVRLTIPAKPEYITLSRLALAGLARVRPLSDETLADLNAWLEERCLSWARTAAHPVQRDRTVMAVYEAEDRPALVPPRVTEMPLPGGRVPFMIR